jgi:predicted ATPase
MTVVTIGERLPKIRRCRLGNMACLPEPVRRPRCGPPLPLTSLVGREREMARLRVLIGGHRLVTLTGPGGCGKTRLAAAVAGDVAPGLADGVCWVELATLADAALVPQAVARALDVREQPGQRLEQLLCRRLGPVGLLLVLDNCEHLARACAVLAAGLLSRCGALRIVATSRVSLGGHRGDHLAGPAAGGA